MYRLVADEGKLLTLDGENTTSCADVESIEGWYEIDAPITPTESGYINAGGIK
jgi:hypothetical protein